MSKTKAIALAINQLLIPAIAVWFMALPVAVSSVYLFIYSYFEYQKVKK